MKVKFKLNAESIKGLLIQHGEKIAFGVGVLLFSLFVYAAIGKQVLEEDKQPVRLLAEKKLAEDHVHNSDWVPKREQIEVADYIKRAKRDPLVEKDYALAVFFDRPLFESKGKRPDPNWLPVEKLVATAGVGTLALAAEDAAPEDDDEGRPGAARLPGGVRPPPPAPEKDKDKKGKKKKPGAAENAAAPAAPANFGQVEIPKRGFRAGMGSNLKGAYWAVVTGLVPVKKQAAEFDVFQKALGENKERDVPEYVGYRIERAEVTGDNLNDLDWQELKLAPVIAFMKKWSDAMPEIVKPEFVDPKFAMPLGPLVGRDWDAAVAHLPEVPLEPVVARVPGARPVEPKAAERPAAEDEGFEEMGRPGVGGRGMQFDADDDQQPRAPRGPGGQNKNKFVEYLLFRFFDYTVEPDKRYVYRVKLGLQNPNYGILPKWLKDPQSTKRKLAQTDWSAPTPVVTIPRGVGLLLANVKPSRTEPEANIMLSKLDNERGVEASIEVKVMRGSLGNFDNKDNKPVKVVMPANGMIEELPNVRIQTNSLVLDMRGGKPIKGKDKTLTEPGLLLVLNPDGTLAIHDELEESSTYASKKLPEVQERVKPAEPVYEPKKLPRKKRGEPAPDKPPRRPR